MNVIDDDSYCHCKFLLGARGKNLSFKEFFTGNNSDVFLLNNWPEKFSSFYRKTLERFSVKLQAYRHGTSVGKCSITSVLGWILRGISKQLLSNSHKGLLLLQVFLPKKVWFEILQCVMVDSASQYGRFKFYTSIIIVRLWAADLPFLLKIELTARPWSPKSKPQYFRKLGQCSFILRCNSPCWEFLYFQQIISGLLFITPTNVIFSKN